MGVVLTGSADRPSRARHAVEGLAFVVLAVLVGAVTAFVHATSFPVGGISLPLGLAAATGGGVAVLLLARGWAGTRWGLLLVYLAWLAPTILLTVPTQEGDLVIAGDASGLLFLAAATVIGAVGIGLPLRSSSTPVAPS